MRHRVASTLVLLGAAFALAPAARAASISAGGNAGVVFQRNDASGSAGVGTGSSWDWDFDAFVNGTPLRPDILDLQLRGGYQTLREQYAERPSSTTAWNYQLAAAILSGSPLNLNLAATRGWGAYTSGPILGSTLATTESASASLRLDSLPTLRASVLRTDLETHSPAGPVLNGGATTISLGASQAAGPAQYAVGYDISTSSGTQAQTNYRNHALTLALSSSLSPDIDVRLNERYFLRAPTVDDPTNPRYEDQLLSMGVSVFPAGRATGKLDYTYAHASLQAAGRTSSETTSQTVTGLTSFQWTPELLVAANASLASGLTLLGDQRRDRTGETTGVSAQLRQPLGSRLVLSLGGGASGGAIESPDEPTTPTWGGSGQAGLSYGTRSFGAHLTYSGSYQENGVTLSGHSLEHRAELGAEHSAGSVWLSAAVSGSLSRRDDALLGKYESRTLSLTGTATWRRYQLQLSVGDTYGTSTAIAGPTAPEGLLLPTSFNARTQYALASATAGFDGGHLFVTLLGHTARSQDPDGLLRYENGADLSVRYTLGAFTLSLEDHLTKGGFDGAAHVGNAFLLGVTRSF